MKSFLRTVDDSDLSMGSGTFGGIGSGNGVTPPAMPRTTLCVPDGPAACVVYELALDGSGNTTGAPARRMTSKSSPGATSISSSIIAT